MDDVDRAILARIRRDARTTNAALGADLDLSEGAVRHRVARMVADGTILRFSAVTRPLGPEGVVLIRCRPGATRKVVDRLRTESVDLFETSGEFDLGATIESATMESFNEALDRIRGIPGVESTTTLIRLTRYVGSPRGRPPGRKSRVPRRAAPKPARS